MKPKPKKKLDDYLEAEFAEAEAQVEIETAQTFSPYRVDEDLSYRLDIPRDVEGLVELLEKKIELRNKLATLKDSNYEFKSIFSLVGILYTLAGILNQDFDSGDYLLLGIAGLFTGILGDGLLYRVSSKRKKFEEEKPRKIMEAQEKIATIDQKLSHYETHYHLSDIALVDDPELGYSLGRVIKNEKEEFVLHQSYHKLKVNYGWTKTSEEKPLAQADIISILKPSIQLSGDDLRSLEEGTPVLCASTELLTSKPADHFSEYGFIDNKNTDDIFKIRTLRTFQGPGEHWYKFNQVQEGKINAYLLVPEIK